MSKGEIRINNLVTMMEKLLIVAACLALGSAVPLAQEPASAREQPKHVYVDGSPLKINCVIPTELGKNVKYEWRKDGETLPPSKAIVETDGSIRIPKSEPSTEGTYECLAKSDLGVASSGPIAVKMAYINLPQNVKTQTHTPVRGEPFELACPQVDAYPKAEIAWLRLEKPFDSTRKKQYITVRTTIGPNGHFYFANVTDEDAGKDYKYVCGTVHPSAPSVDVLVLAEHVIEGLKEGTPVAKKAVAQYVSEDVVAQEGDAIFLYCIFGGALAPPDYFFDGKNVNGDDDPQTQRITRHNRSKGRRLAIKDVRMSDQGSYTCKITDTDGSVIERTMKLTVASAPKFVQKPATKTATKQGDVIIPCRVNAAPKPKITWTYNAKPLFMTTGGKITFISSGKSGYKVDLEIKGVEKSDVGYYGCRATNEYGEVYAETLLSVA
ncbi:immunoglobulin domain-containing protein [Phthorimaea operculella]|nr:immunoglobulin domain-containing protein [Phthorimaea operculella]